MHSLDFFVQIAFPEHQQTPGWLLCKSFLSWKHIITLRWSLHFGTWKYKASEQLKHQTSNHNLWQDNLASSILNSWLDTLRHSLLQAYKEVRSERENWYMDKKVGKKRGHHDEKVRKVYCKLELKSRVLCNHSYISITKFVVI